MTCYDEAADIDTAKGRAQPLSALIISSPDSPCGKWSVSTCEDSRTREFHGLLGMIGVSSWASISNQFRRRSRLMPMVVCRVAGARVTLLTLIDAFQEGATPEEIYQEYPSVSLADVIRRHRLLSRPPR